jgi:hypothetical protein
VSNHLAIATATTALAQIIQASFLAAQPELKGAEVKTLRPESPQLKPPFMGANLYLYQVVHNAAFRNSDLATRNADGQLLQRPQVALDLNYLLTFYGDDGTLEPQRLMGCAVSALHAQPLLTRQVIVAAIAAAGGADGWLAGSNLADQLEAVKLTALYMNLDELSKLWTVYAQEAHTLSLSYQASLVLIDAPLTPLAAALPARMARVSTEPMQLPSVASVTSQAGADAPFVYGSTLIIAGEHLGGHAARVSIGGFELPVLPAQASDTQLSVQLNRKELRAGATSLQVLRPARLSAGTAAFYVESNVVPLLLRPTVRSVTVTQPTERTGQTRAAQLNLTVAPAVAAYQQVTLLLSELGGGDSYTFYGEPPTKTTTTLGIAVSGVAPGTYLVRLRVDGAESMLRLNERPTSPAYNHYVAPRVRIR